MRGIVPESPDVREHGTHFPFASLSYPGRHVFRQAPELSSKAIDAFRSFVPQPATVHPEEYVGHVPASPGFVTTHELHAPILFLLYPGRHVFRQTPEPSSEAPDAFGSVVVQAPDSVHPEEYVGEVPGSPGFVITHGLHEPITLV